jgi:uncharacterized protein HemX
MSGVTAATIIAGVTAAATVGSTIYGVVQGKAQQSTQEKALKQQKTAQEQAEAGALVVVVALAGDLHLPAAALGALLPPGPQQGQPAPQQHLRQHRIRACARWRRADGRRYLSSAPVVPSRHA